MHSIQPLDYVSAYFAKYGTYSFPGRPLPDFFHFMQSHDEMDPAAGSK
jgi:hypothetical protein